MGQSREILWFERSRCINKLLT